jgi:succinate dehydrogenase / fumarate reductase cytochrome b subunit
MSAENRPLSPHLQVYKWLWTMMFSIIHRATGVALAVGTLALVCWLMALASGPEYFDFVQTAFGSILGRIALLGWTWSLFYHLSNGIRHLVWDAGWGFELGVAQASGWIVMLSSVVLTLIAWGFGYMALGGQML